MNDEPRKALIAIAPLMRKLRKDPNATFSYDLLSDALIWSDEFPEFRILRTIPHWHVIRLVFNYRSSIILGAPATDWQAYWDLAFELFPNWPGFEPIRRSPALREPLEEMQAGSMKEIEEGLESGP